MKYMSDPRKGLIITQFWYMLPVIERSLAIKGHMRPKFFLKRSFVCLCFVESNRKEKAGTQGRSCAFSQSSQPLPFRTASRHGPLPKRRRRDVAETRHVQVLRSSRQPVLRGVRREAEQLDSHRIHLPAHSARLQNMPTDLWILLRANIYSVAGWPVCFLSITVIVVDFRNLNATVPYVSDEARDLKKCHRLFWCDHDWQKIRLLNGFVELMTLYFERESFCRAVICVLNYKQ